MWWNYTEENKTSEVKSANTRRKIISWNKFVPKTGQKNIEIIKVANEQTIMVRLVSEKIQENKKKRKKTTTSSSTETNRSMELHGFLWVEVFLSGNHSNKEKSKTHNLSFLFSPTRQGVRKQRHKNKNITYMEFRSSKRQKTP